MKKLCILVLALCVCLTACTFKPEENEIKSDSEKAVAENGSDDNTRTPLRMIMADGQLYYDTGLLSDLSPRCGTMDGHLTAQGSAYEIPTKNDTCNFDGATGYQNASSVTKEVFIENEGWCIFKKVDATPESFSATPYCVHLVGRLPNAVKDTDLFILTESLEVTVWDVMSPLFSSKYPNEPKFKTYILSDNTITDKWGLTLKAKEVSPTGCALQFEQLGGDAKGTLQTGTWFEIERLENGKWIGLAPKEAIFWTQQAILIPENGTLELSAEWANIYGALPVGSYRLSKRVNDFIEPENTESELYYAYFDITEALCGYPPAE